MTVERFYEIKHVYGTCDKQKNVRVKTNDYKDFVSTRCTCESFTLVKYYTRKKIIGLKSAKTNFHNASVKKYQHECVG